MQDNAFLQKVIDLLRENFLVVGVFLAGLILFSIGLIQLFGAKSADISFKSGQDIVEKSDAERKKVMVDVGGAVVKPGLYALPFDARVQDALIAAGGLNQNADRIFVSKNINLALKVTDGMKIYIPKSGEIDSSIPIQGVSLTPNSNLININSASIDQLDALPGVGKVTAQKIIDARPYSTIDELVTKKAVSQKVFTSIKDKIDL